MQRSPAQSLAAQDQVSLLEMRDLKRKAPTKAILPLDFINTSVLTEASKYGKIQENFQLTITSCVLCLDGFPIYIFC